MGATDAERAKRYRRHRAGDHSICLPERCDEAVASSEAVTPPVTVTTVTENRDVTLGRRGAQLWLDLRGETEPDPARKVLIQEACRLADRLDQLDAVLTGRADAWLRFSVGETGGEVTVVIDRALSEARQQQLALRAIVAELRQRKDSGASGQEGGILDQLAARRAARRATATGS